MAARCELVEVSKRFGAQTALHGLSLRVPAGEIIALVGPNGAGKTTVTRILATLLRPSAGRVFVAGHDAVEDPVSVRRLIAVVPQGVMPDPYANAWEHVYHYLRARGVGRAAALERTTTTLSTLDLWDRRRTPARQLSGGYQRRVILPMAVATRPRLLLLDEPTTALDPAARRQLWNRLAELRADTSIIVTTHDMAEAEMLSDRIALLSAGRLVAADTLPALLRRLPATEAFVVEPGDIPDNDYRPYGHAQRIAGRILCYPYDPEAARALARLLVRVGAAFSVRPVNLEDCYFHLLADSADNVATADSADSTARAEAAPKPVRTR